MDFKSKPTFFISIVIVIIIAAIGFWYWQSKKAVPRRTVAPFSELTPAEARDTLGGQILGKTQNPLEGELPPTNPFEETETNPLKDVYRNPFE
ncbi:MAG: hypothetical protein HY445_03140 [Candidatus Niyogibacteria bacterium]|nr:hypothetical protein [Candidatus Niyogibacteria bacterium]